MSSLKRCRTLWEPGPVSHHGEFFDFTDVWLEPRPWRAEGPTMWFGGQGMHAPLLRRLVRYGHGLNPFGPLTDDDLTRVKVAMAEAGRDPDSLELVGGIRGTFQSSDDTADLDEALLSLPEQLAQGYTTICFKPSMFIDDPEQIGPLCRDLVARVERLAG